MWRLFLSISALNELARATRAKSNDFAWPWDQDAHHAKPIRLSNMMATRSRTSSHDFGSSFDASSFGEDSTSSSDSGDFMDKYISEAGEKPLQITSNDAKPQPKQDAVPDMASIFGEDNAASKPAPRSFSSDSSDTASSFAADLGNMFGASGFDAPAPAPKRAPVDDSTSDSDSASGWPWSGHNKRRGDSESRSHSLWDSDNTNAGSSSSGSSDNSISSSATDTFSKMFSSWSGNDVSGNAAQDSPKPAAPQNQDSMDRPADSPIEGPPQRVSSLSGASATDQVVDVRLSSELQQSLLQAKKDENKMFSNFRGVA